MQVATLKDQLGRELQKKQQYIKRTAAKNEETKDLRNQLGESLVRVSRDTAYEPAVLDEETRRLDESLEYRTGYSSRSPTRRTKSTGSPTAVNLSKYSTSTPSGSSHPVSAGGRRVVGSTPSSVSPLRKTGRKPTR